MFSQVLLPEMKCKRLQPFWPLTRKIEGGPLLVTKMAEKDPPFFIFLLNFLKYHPKKYPLSGENWNTLGGRAGIPDLQDVNKLLGKK